MPSCKADLGSRLLQPQRHWWDPNIRATAGYLRRETRAPVSWALHVRSRVLSIIDDLVHEPR